MATVARTALRRIGGRSFRPSLAAAAHQHQQPHPTPPRSMVAVPHRSWSSTPLPAIVPPTPDINRKFHLDVSGKLLPEIGFTTDHAYRISICDDNADSASNIVRDFLKALQSNRPEDLEAYLRHQVSIVEVKKVVSGAAIEITLQGIERTAEIRFEIEALKQMVVDEATSTRAGVESLKTVVADTKKELQELKTSTSAQVGCLKTAVAGTQKEVQELQTDMSDKDFATVVFRNTVANVACAFLVFLSGKVTFTVTEAAVDFVNHVGI
ncbi:hypothetical protein VPH35_017563 [Triticum aestivum]|uniref:uncharacterized protein n=1 Tax=Triticum aestivum TaxID=4565 RepID=UPI001D005C44|nr:uncharacterized protein LOC123179354 [Triticum aestivum]